MATLTTPVAAGSSTTTTTTTKPASGLVYTVQSGDYLIGSPSRWG